MSNYTRDVDATIQARIQRDRAYTQALWNEAAQLFLEGEPQTTKIILRDLGNATVGFEALADRIHKPSKSVHRMLCAAGNPTMDNMLAIFQAVKPGLEKRGAKRLGHHFATK
jgi:DNA-binding phage protein